MSDTPEVIKAYIEQQVESHAYMGNSAMVERFVLRNGHVGIGKARPKGVRKMADRQCYANSARAIIDNRFPGMTYVEGLAMNKDIGMLINHAWLEDADHTVLDLTWRDPANALYYGVPFTKDELRENIVKNGVYGLLLQFDMYNVDLIYRKDRELEDIVNKIIAERKARMSPIFKVTAAA